MSNKTAKDHIENLINKGFEFRQFQIEKYEERKAEDGSAELIVEGVPVVYDVETVLYRYKNYECREKIDKNAFVNCDFSDTIFNVDHKGRVYARTRNNTLKLEATDKNLKMTAKLRADDNGHKELYEDIKSRNLDRMSFAFRAAKDKYETIESNDGSIVDVRTVLEIDKLYDVSAVGIPAYDETSISARSVFSAERERREAESREIARRSLELKLIEIKLS